MPRIDLCAIAPAYLALIMLPGLVAQPACAETFLGEESSPTIEAAPEAAPAAKKVPSQKAPALPDENSAEENAEAALQESEPVNSEGHGNFTFGGAIGAGSGFVSGQATVGYYFNKFVGVETTYYYYQLNSDNASGQQYGPEIDLVLRAANPTIVTPFVGAGPGYTTWQRTYSGKTFDSGSSSLGNDFYGLDVRLTPHFGIQIMRKQQTYWNTPPISFDDRSSHEARTTWATNIGFRLAF